MALCFLFTIVFTYPMMNFPLRISLHYLAFGETDTTNLQHLAETLLPLALALTGALTVKDVGVVFAVVGAIGTASTFFLFPTLLYLRSNKIHARPGGMKVACVCLFVLGLVVMICGLWAALIS